MTDNTFFVKSTPPRTFIRSFQRFADTDILKICIKKLDAEKNIFWQIDRVFNLAIFWQLHLVNNGW